MNGPKKKIGPQLFMLETDSPPQTAIPSHHHYTDETMVEFCL